MSQESLQETGGKPERQGSLGDLFRFYRLEIGLTQEALAGATEEKVSVRTIRNIERNAPYSPAMREKVLQALNELRRLRGSPPLRLWQEGDRCVLGPQSPGWLEFPNRRWLKLYYGPGSMLTAEFHIVPFHGQRSRDELQKLTDWCLKSDRVSLRIYKGEGGMGKTRLAVELCHQLGGGEKATWTAGFAQCESFPTKSDPWKALPDLRRPLLVVVDYAGDEEKTRLVSQLLAHLEACPAPKIRLLFLERDDIWLERLHEHNVARDILLGPLVSREGADDVHTLAPVATSSGERTRSFETALEAFSKKLGLRRPATVDDGWKDALYDRVLFIHMKALVAVFGAEARGKRAILQHLYARERDYWRKRLSMLGLSAMLLPVIEAAVQKISSRNGVPDFTSARQLLSEVELFRSQTEVVQLQILRLLRECYPQGQMGIGPLQPDLFKDYLSSRFV